jgi:hypothetical protein
VKRKGGGDENVSDYKIYKKRSAPGYFQYMCELLANDEKTLYEISIHLHQTLLEIGKNSV